MTVLGTWVLAASLSSAAPPSAPSAAAPALVSPMNGGEIIQMLDEVIDWYRALGAQQADEPSDLLILTENRQISNQLVGLAFDVARATAALLANSSSTETEKGSPNRESTPLAERQRKIDAQALAIQNEIDTDRAKLAEAAPKARTALQAKIAELQGELDLVNAKKSMLASIAGALSGNDPTDAGSLRAQIDAMAVALPAASASGSSSGTAAAGSTAVASHPSAPTAASPLAAEAGTAGARFGLWDQVEAAFNLSQKSTAIAAVDRRTQSLQGSLSDVRKRVIDAVRALSAHGDELMAKADSADSATLGDVRGELDAMAVQYKEASAIIVPLSKQLALLEQYRRNLDNWRDAIRSQFNGVLKALAVRVGLLLVVLAVVFVLGAVWHRAVLKYVQDSRRRYQLLLIRRIVLWSVVVIIVGIAFASELGSVVTFAGLITAGLAVAMQSVLVSIVGYFFLIGKYGLRIGDRVQIGDVNGEIIEIGLVRMYLMELARPGPGGPTGRVAAFPNSVVFQVSTGLFKQLPGINVAWHDITLSLPPHSDHASIKEKLFVAANEALADYREEIERQTLELERTTLSGAGGDALPTVQLTYSPKGVDARVRYPVHLAHAGEIDERMSKALLQVVSNLAPEDAGR